MTTEAKLKALLRKEAKLEQQLRDLRADINVNARVFWQEQGCVGIPPTGKLRSALGLNN